MKYFNKQILEAINKGVQLALDDYEDIEDNNSISSDIIDTDDVIKNKIELNKCTVDLGLPSGTLWCKYNLGCDYDLLNNNPYNTKPEDWYGDYYAWGEIEPKDNYTWKNYKFGEILQLTKYCTHNANDKNNFVDGLIELQLEDDAAYQNMHMLGFNYKIPNKEQIKELITYAKVEFIYRYKNIIGLNGLLFIGKNNKELFLPAGGSFKYDHGELCEYWSSTLQSANKNVVTKSSRKNGNISGNWSAYALEYQNGFKDDWIHRADGLLIRAVKLNYV